jgi:competence protein ComEC
MAIAVRDANGVLRVSGARTGSYVVGQFFDEEGGPPTDADALREGVSCDASGCLLRDRTGQSVSHVRDASAFAEDCARATVLVTRLVAPEDCRAPLIVDATRLARFGAHAIWIARSEAGPVYRIVTDRSATPRPWQTGAAKQASEP